MLNGQLNIVSRLVLAFSGHCEISRSHVDNSSCNSLVCAALTAVRQNEIKNSKCVRWKMRQNMNFQVRNWVAVIFTLWNSMDISDYNINLNPIFNWYFLSDRVLWRAREKCTDSGLAGQICAVKRLHKEQTGRSDANLGNKVPYSIELSTNLYEVSQWPEKAPSSPCWKHLLAISQLRMY